MTETWKITLSKATLELDNASFPLSVTQMRGYVGNLFIDDSEFHHHSERSYHYPLVQYKRVDDKLMVVGLQEYARILLDKVAGLDHISTPHGSVNVRAIDIRVDTYEVDSNLHYYRFITPWIALNEDNYQKFRSLRQEMRKKFLERILTANILSALKWLGIFVDYRVAPAISAHDPTSVRAHNNIFEAFHANFSVNVGLPDYIGLGKSVSKGFGCIRRIVDAPRNQRTRKRTEAQPRMPDSEYSF